MTDLFLKLLNVSISGSYLVLAVVLLRLCLKSAPKWVNPLLWAIVAVRLLLPVSIESNVSMIPDPEPVSREVITAYIPNYSFESPADRSANRANTQYSQSVEVKTELSGDELMAIVWAAGAAAMVSYTLLSYLRLRHRVKKAVKFDKNIFISCNVSSPFVLGLFRPRIYLPAGILGEQEMACILSHEQAHIRRHDHWWKPLGFVLLALHWFNPLMWAAYILLCRDIELACDEKVIRSLNREDRADYSQALLTCSIRRRSIAACPLAFGEVGVKQRVKSVLNYRKPGFWVILIAILTCAVLAVCFLTNPREELKMLTMEDVYRLQAKGDRLTWKDLEDYAVTEVNSYSDREDDGMVSRIYPIDNGFSLKILYTHNGEIRPPFPSMGLECNACEDAGMWLTYDTREEIEAFLTAHSREMEDWENNHWGICLHLNNPTPTGAAFYWDCDQLPQGVQARAGELFYIERWEGQEWAFLAPLEGKDWNWDEYSSYNFVNETVDWTDVYGVLPGGRYRISKYIDVQYNGKTRENLKASAEFTIIAGSDGLTCDYVLDMYQRDMNIGWDSFSGFSYVDLPDPRYQMVHRYFDLEGPLAISINGPSMDQRPNSVVLFCENEPDTVVLLHHRLSWQAVQRFMEVHSQPLAESQTSHWGIDMAVTDFTPTGATLDFTGEAPEDIGFFTSDGYILTRLNARGQWEAVPTIDGSEEMVATTYPTESLHSYTLDWTERYGALTAGTYRVEKDVEICYLGRENESYSFARRVSAPFKIDASMPGVGQEALPADALTIDDLLRLSEKGENLNWEDFEGFPYEETGFGQRIRSYPMAAPFSFQISADPLDRNIPQSFRLLCQVEDVGIDIREDRKSLDTFLLVHSRDLLPGQTNHWDIKLEVTSPETTGTAYLLSRGTIPPEAWKHTVVTAGDQVYLEQQTAGGWMQVAYLAGMEPTGEGFDVSQFGKRSADWEKTYGELQSGHYRLGKKIMVCYQDRPVETFLVWDEFNCGYGFPYNLAELAKPFDPDNLAGLTAILWDNGQRSLNVYDKGKQLLDIRKLLSTATPEKGAPSCPFSSTFYLQIDNREYLAFQHAEDSCNMLKCGDAYFSYDPGLGQNVWELLGIPQYEVKDIYYSNGLLARQDTYEWGQRVPGSTVTYQYDWAGNLKTKMYLNEDETVDHYYQYDYDHWGNPFKWWHYEGNQLQSWGIRSYNEDRLLKETSYDEKGDETWETEYTYDDAGRLLTEKEFQRGELVETRSYDWEDEHSYRLRRYSPDGACTGSYGIITDRYGRVLKRSFLTSIGTLEGWEEYEYVEDEQRYIVRCYDKNGVLTEEGWRYPD